MSSVYGTTGGRMLLFVNDNCALDTVRVLEHRQAGSDRAIPGLVK
jgi:hypothetical protein